MTHEEFIKKWIWKKYIEPWMQTVECVWGVKNYCKERGFPIKSFWGSAWNGWVTWSPFDSTWKRVVKTPFNYPKEWDIIFFNESRCKYWHVAVANKFCNPLTLRYLDENGTGKWDAYTNRFWTYLNVCGWFTKK